MLSVEAATGNEVLKGCFHQLDDSGNELENGIHKDDASFSLELMKDTQLKDLFTGKKVNDNVVFDVKKAFPSETDLRSLLNINKDQLDSLSPVFRFDIKEISRFIKAEFSQELYDMMYGKDVVHNDEEFNAQITKELQGRLEQNSEFKFRLDARDQLMKKVKMDLPASFLKKWLKFVNKDKMADKDLEEEYPKFENDLKWQLIQDQIIRGHDIKVADEEISDYAKTYTLLQFRQYGITDIPEEQLKTYSENVLKNQDERKKIVERLYEEKVFKHIKEHVKVDKKKITREKFNKLFDK
jgi:trigger factor